MKMKKSHSNLQRWLLLWVVALFWFAQYVYIPFQTPYLAARNLTSNAIGTIIGAYGITQLVLRAPAGVFADARGRHKPFMVLALFTAGLASVFRILMPDGTGFLIANLCSGFAASMWICFIVFYTGFFSPEEEQKATGQIITFNNMGMLFGFIAATVFYGRFGMRFLCLLSCICAFAGTFMALFIQEPKEEKAVPPIKELIRVFGNRRLIVFSLLALIQQGIQMSTTMSFTSQILKNMGASSLMVGISTIIYMVSAVFTSWLSSTEFCARSGPKRWIPGVFLAAFFYCVMVPLAPSPYLICALQLLPGMCTGILMSYLMSECVKEIPREKKSSAMGFFQAVYAVGMTLFPMFTGAVAESVSMKAAYFLLALTTLIGSTGAVIYYHHEKIRGNTP